MRPNSARASSSSSESEWPSPDGAAGAAPVHALDDGGCRDAADGRAAGRGTGGLDGGLGGRGCRVGHDPRDDGRGRGRAGAEGDRTLLPGEGERSAGGGAGRWRDAARGPRPGRRGPRGSGEHTGRRLALDAGDRRGGVGGRGRPLGRDHRGIARREDDLPRHGRCRAGGCRGRGQVGETLERHEIGLRGGVLRGCQAADGDGEIVAGCPVRGDRRRIPGGGRGPGGRRIRWRRGRRGLALGRHAGVERPEAHRGADRGAGTGGPCPAGGDG